MPAKNHTNVRAAGPKMPPKAPKRARRSRQSVKTPPKAEVTANGANGIGHHLNGSGPSLADLRSEVREAGRTVEQLAAQINYAEEARAHANRQLAAEQEATRLRELSSLGTTRIQLARQIDQLVGDLEKLFAEFDEVGGQMNRLIPPLDDAARLKTDGQSRLNLLVATKLRNLDISANVSDPRYGQSLTEMESDTMSGFIMTDREAGKLAEMKIAID